jgi:hypothetical protein
VEETIPKPQVIIRSIMRVQKLSKIFIDSSCMLVEELELESMSEVLKQDKEK